MFQTWQMQKGCAGQSAPHLPQHVMMAPVVAHCAGLPLAMAQFPVQQQTCQQQPFQQVSQVVAPLQQQTFQQQPSCSLSSSCLTNSSQPISMDTRPICSLPVAQGNPLDECEVIAAVESLYRDQLR